MEYTVEDLAFEVKEYLTSVLAMLEEGEITSARLELEELYDIVKGIK